MKGYGFKQISRDNDVDFMAGILNSDLVLHTADSYCVYSFSVVSGYIYLYSAPEGGTNVGKSIKVKVKPTITVNPKILRYLTIVASGTKAQYQPFEVYLMDSANVLTRVFQYGNGTATLPVSINTKIDLNTIATLENKAYTLVIAYGPYGNQSSGSAYPENKTNINLTALKMTKQ